MSDSINAEREESSPTRLAIINSLLFSPPPPVIINNNSTPSTPGHSPGLAHIPGFMGV